MNKMLSTSTNIVGILVLLLMAADTGTHASHVQSLGTGGAYCTCVLLGGGKVKCWGYNGYGVLGQGSTTNWGSDPSLLPKDMPAIDLGTGLTATAVAAGAYHTCAILNDGRVKCWGQNDVGQLGLGSSVNIVGTQPADMGDALQYVKYLEAPVTALALGPDFTCAVQSTGAVRCWGHNLYGTLGRDDVNYVGTTESDTVSDVALGAGRTAKSICAGWVHVCAILDNDGLKCWGGNGFGQLGIDSTQDQGKQPGQMGDNLPYVNLGAGRTAKQISCGDYYTCAVLDDNTVKCWGSSYAGALGQGNAVPYGTSASSMATLTHVNVGTGRTVKAVSAGSGHTCAILDNDDLKCWGYNYYGHLGIGSTNSIGDDAGEMGDSLVTTNLGTGRVAVSIAAHYGHTCALLDNGDVKCWGENYWGQLGQGNTQTLGDSPSETGDNLPAVDLPLAHRPPPPSPSPSPPPPSPSPPPPPPSPPHPPGKRYDCRTTKQYLVGAKQIENFKAVVPGNSKPTDAERAAECKSSCETNDDCNGYVYKTDRTCILKSQVTGFTTQIWDNIYIACRVVA